MALKVNKILIDLLWNLQVQLTFQMKIYWVPCGRNSSYSFQTIVLTLCRCFFAWDDDVHVVWIQYLGVFFLTFSAL